MLARSRSAGPPAQTPFDVADVARRAVVGARRRPSPVIPVIRGDGVVRGDAEAIERAIRNVVENALRYARHEVEVLIDEEGDDVIVAVRDDGPGFPAAWLEQGVGRFAAGDSPESHGGAGLGLAIVDAIVGSHGGAVAVGTAPGGGAEVRLQLPREHPVDVTV